MSVPTWSPRGDARLQVADRGRRSYAQLPAKVVRLRVQDVRLPALPPQDGSLHEP